MIMLPKWQEWKPEKMANRRHFDVLNYMTSKVALGSKLTGDDILLLNGGLDGRLSQIFGP